MSETKKAASGQLPDPPSSVACDWRAMHWAWAARPLLQKDGRIKPSVLVVLIAIAARRNSKTGTSWPGYELVAADTGLNRSTVAQAISELEVCGVLICDSGKRGRRSNRYSLNIDLIARELEYKLPEAATELVDGGLESSPAMADELAKLTVADPRVLEGRKPLTLRQSASLWKLVIDDPKMSNYIKTLPEMIDWSMVDPCTRWHRWTSSDHFVTNVENLIERWRKAETKRDDNESNGESPQEYAGASNGSPLEDVTSDLGDDYYVLPEWNDDDEAPVV